MEYNMDVDALQECLCLLPIEHWNGVEYVRLDDVLQMIKVFPKRTERAATKVNNTSITIKDNLVNREESREVEVDGGEN